MADVAGCGWRTVKMSHYKRDPPRVEYDVKVGRGCHVGHWDVLHFVSAAADSLLLNVATSTLSVT